MLLHFKGKEKHIALLLFEKPQHRRVEGGWCSSRSSKPLSVREWAEVGSIPTLSAKFNSIYG